jgi:hypothetical protein
MNPIRPDGMVERLEPARRPTPAFAGYGRAQSGGTTAAGLQLAAEQDRRRQRRHRPDPLRGRLVDLTA